MSSAPESRPREPQGLPAAGGGRHLRLVPPPPAPLDGADRRLRETRWLTALVAVATAAIVGLSIAGLVGAADAPWWPLVVGAVFVMVVAFGIAVVRELW